MAPRRPHPERIKGRVKKRTAFTKDQLSEFKEAFGLFDQNSDGHISASELAEVMQSLGQMPSEEEVREMLANADVDSNGTIEWEEFVMMMENKARDIDTREEINEAFKAFDLGGDGKITPTILMEGMATLGEVLTEEECEKIIQEVGSDGKTVNFAQFKAMMLGETAAK